jgi:DNA-binding GntR family transcriptional regulator
MIDATPLSQQILSELKEEIISGRLRPNQRISIEELAQRWKVSTTPVRDAVHNLELAGFVVVAPRKSIMVANLDLKAFKDIFDLRIALECCAVELAILRISDRVLEDALESFHSANEDYRTTGSLARLEQVDNLVHQIILDYCDNPKLVSTMDQLHDQVTWARRIVINQPKSYGEAAGEHIRILECLKSRQVQLAVQAMRSHLANSFERTVANWTDSK